ncbi:MAG: hypothetical protein WAQ72_06820, partial [Dethiobacteria bacterium]
QIGLGPAHGHINKGFGNLVELISVQAVQWLFLPAAMLFFIISGFINITNRKGHIFHLAGCCFQRNFSFARLSQITCLPECHGLGCSGGFMD